MAGFEQTYECLEDFILRDQFFIACDKPLQTFLKEKGKMTRDRPKFVFVFVFDAENDYF